MGFFLGGGTGGSIGFGAFSRCVRGAGRSLNPLWGDWGLVMGFLEDVKRGRLSVGL